MTIIGDFHYRVTVVGRIGDFSLGAYSYSWGFSLSVLVPEGAEQCLWLEYGRNVIDKIISLLGIIRGPLLCQATSPVKLTED